MKTSEQLVTAALKTIREVSVNALSQLKNQPIQLIDIREADEVADGVIPEAIWLPRGLLEFQILSLVEQHNWNTNKELYICCRSGKRSVLASLSLLDMGFKKPVSVAGGFNAWKEAGYSVTTAFKSF